MRDMEECVYYVILLIIIILFFYMFFPSNIQEPYTVSTPVVASKAHGNEQPLNIEQSFAIANPDNAFLLSEGENMDGQVYNMRCSKSCCGQQWRVPHNLEYDPIVCQNRDDYVSTNFTCSNQYTSGCACIPRKLRNYLADHGGNQ